VCLCRPPGFTHIKHFNFWSLDVGGGELQVLVTTSTSFSAVVVEADGHNREKDQAVRDLEATVTVDEHIKSNGGCAEVLLAMPC
jgi:hypothetical protein